MTEWEWLAGEDPMALLAAIPTAGSRKLRLFGVACLKQNWDLLTDVRLRTAVLVAERYADGRATEAERAAAESDTWDADDRIGDFQYHIDAAIHIIRREYTTECARACAHWLSHSAEYYAEDVAFDGLGVEIFVEQASFVRDIFGNPFRPVVLDPAWLTFTVLALAHGIYEERAFDRLPILADALMDAGCANDDVLNHCRGDGPHVRGCWVVGLILGKA